MAMLLYGFTQAQVSKESYDKAVDLLNCRTVEYALKDSRTKDVAVQFSENCKCQDIPDFNLIISSIARSETRTIELANEIEGLKKSFKENWKKEEIVAFLTEGIFADNAKYKKIFAFADKRKGKPEFDTYKTDLSDKLIENIPQENIASINTETSHSSLEYRLAELEKNLEANNDKSWFSGITSQIIVVAFLVSLLLSFLTIFLAYRLFSNDSVVSSGVKNYVKEKIDEFTFIRNTPSNQSYNSVELRDAKNRINDLELLVKNLCDKINTAPVSNFSSQTIQPAVQEAKQLEVKTESFFLSTPNSDGSFNESSASSAYKDGATIYRFTKIGSNRAKFQIDEKDASAKLALQYPDKNIDPVCDAVNAFNPKATRITTVEQGEAELQGGKWIVEKNKKAKIKYEN